MSQPRLPVSEPLRPFKGLTAEDLGPAPEWSGCAQCFSAHGNVVFRRQSDSPKNGLGEIVISGEGYQEIRDLLRERCPNVRLKVWWHVAECLDCGARVVRPGLVARLLVEASGGLFIEREYAIEGPA